MRGGRPERPASAEAMSARGTVARSRSALAGFLVEVERLGESLAASTESLEQREAVVAADEAAGLLSLAADALRDGSARLLALENGAPPGEWRTIAAAARAGGVR